MAMLAPLLLAADYFLGNALGIIWWAIIILQLLHVSQHLFVVYVDFHFVGVERLGSCAL